MPYLTVFSSESDARLTFLLPKGSEVNKGELIAEQDNYYLQQELQRLEQEQKSSELELTYSADEFKRLSELKANMVSPSKLNNFSLKRDQATLNYDRITNKINELKHQKK